MPEVQNALIHRILVGRALLILATIVWSLTTIPVATGDAIYLIFLMARTDFAKDTRGITADRRLLHHGGHPWCCCHPQHRLPPTLRPCLYLNGHCRTFLFIQEN